MVQMYTGMILKPLFFLYLSDKASAIKAYSQYSILGWVQTTYNTFLYLSTEAVLGC